MHSHSTSAKTLILHCHPAAYGKAVNGVRVAVTRAALTELRLVYCIDGEVAQLAIPQHQSPQRIDKLWRHTCAELFLAVPDQDAYWEFNFSPSSAWAAYAFDAYRQNIRPLDIEPPSIKLATDADTLMLAVTVKLPDPLTQAVQLQLGLTMVVEEHHGRCSYWALAHGAVRPDFHRRDSFTLLV